MIDLRQREAWLRWDIVIGAALSALGYGFALAHTAAAYFPTIGLTWWFYVLLLAAAVAGVVLPIRRESEASNVGRLMLGLVWLLAPAFIGSIGAVLHGGWSVDELLLHGASPGGLLLCAFVMASSLGDACVLLLPLGEASVQAEVEARRSSEGFHQLLTTAFKGWILLALAGSGLVDAVIPLPDMTVSRWSLGLGAAFGIGATLFTLHLAYIRVQQWVHAAEGDEQVVLMNRNRAQVVLPFVSGVAVLALMIPANLSPIARHGMGGFFQWLTDRAAPLFVPGRRSARSGGLMDRLLDGVLSRFTEGTGAEEAASRLSLVVTYVLTVLVLAGTAFALWRFGRLMQLRGGGDVGGARYREGSLLKQLIVWLWDQLRNLFRAVARWAEAQSRGGEVRKKKDRARRRKERQEDLMLGPALRIRVLFARWLRQMARLGYPRERDETPYEYAQRLTVLRPDARAELKQTADIYVKARYSAEQELSTLERAYEALKGAVSEALQAIRRKSADPR